MDSEDLTRLIEGMDEVRSRLLVLMHSIDIIVCPEMGVPAVRQGATKPPTWKDSYCGPYNVLGWPAAVVRGDTSPEGLPIEVQILGRPWREDVVLAVAALVEVESGGWKAPPI